MSIAAKCTCFKRPSGWCSGDDCPKAIKQNDDKQLIEKYSVIIAEFMGIESKIYSDTPTLTHYNFNGSMLLAKDMKFHTDWNEIHKLKFKVVNDGRFDIRDEKCLKYKGLLNHCLLYKETPYEAFKIIGETIEYLNTIKK